MNLTNNSSNDTFTTSQPNMVAPQGPTYTQDLIFKIGLLTVAVFAVTGNGLVIYFVLNKRRLRTKTNAMVVSLAFSDLIVGLALIPSFFACFYVECDNQLSKLFYDVFLFTSVLNLCCITTDRFLAVTRPLTYNVKMTRQTVTVIIALSWIIPAIVCLLPVSWYYTDTGPEKVVLCNKIFYTIQVIAFMFIPCIIMLCAYVVVFNIAWKQSRHIRHVVSTLSISNATSEDTYSTSIARTREARATIKVFGTVVLMFISCWILSAFRSIVLYYELMILSFDVVMASRLLLVANSAVNPIIYALWKRDIRKECVALLRLNKRAVRPTSSATFRSTNDPSGINGRITRNPSSASSLGDNIMQYKKKQASVVNMVQVAEAGDGKREDNKDLQVPSNHHIKEGLHNVAAINDVDGMV